MTMLSIVRGLRATGRRKGWRRRPQFELLDGRAMLSTASPAMTGAAGPADTASQRYFSGTISGHYRTETDPEFDDYLHIMEDGSGTLSPRGQVISVSGHYGTKRGSFRAAISITFQHGASYLILTPHGHVYSYVIGTGLGQGERGTVALRFSLGRYTATFPG